jgi:polysaccharide biosynthesis/export protein PslD
MIDRRRILWGVLGAAVAASTAGCASGQSRPTNRVQRGGFSDIAFADWTDAEPEYVLYPGDEIDVALPTATELNRSLRVGPDGRIALPLIGQAMAADRTLAELEYTLSEAYASQLVRPVVEITLKQAGPIQVWVAGEVRTPGVIALTGDLDAYQAIVQAGDFLATAKPQEVALIRRGPGGVRMMRVVDLRPRRGEVVALRRGDILYVPRSSRKAPRAAH